MYYLLDIYIFVPWSLSPRDQSSNTISACGVMSANVGEGGGGGGVDSIGATPKDNWPFSLEGGGGQFESLSDSVCGS